MFTKNSFVRIVVLTLLFTIAMNSAAPGRVHAISYAVTDTPGALDTTFDSDGLVTTSIGSFHAWGKAVAIQSDGKIVVSGPQFNTHYDGEFAVVRYNEDGSLDTTFDYDGIVTTNINSYRDDIVNDLVIQEDGKIVVIGYSADNTNSDAVVWALVRFNPNGSLDTSFDGDGKVTTDIGPFFDTAYSAAIQSDGRIVVAGFTTSISDIDGFRKNDIAIVRYNTNGSLDPSFGNNGIIVTQSPNNSGLSALASSLAIQSDGKIVVGGAINGLSDLALIRYNGNGSLDTSFDVDGIITINGNVASEPPKIALHNDRILFVSYRYFDRYFYLARFNHDGSLDTSFDSDGQVITTFGYIIDLGDVAIQSNGKIIVAGSGVPVDNLDFLLIRYMEDGSLDTSFDHDGILTTDFGTKQGDRADDIAIQSNGRIIVAGNRYNSTSDVIEVARYMGDKVVHHVRSSALGANNGTSWANAYTNLQTALAAASSGDEIWVAAGTYKPTMGTDRSVSFALENGVAIYGGFAGNEVSLTQRDPANNVTILSGDISITGNDSDNSYHVVIGSGTNNSAILDGFTITAGNANAEMSYQTGGGGIFNYIGSPSLTNLKIVENYGYGGGGMYNLGEAIFLPNEGMGSNPILTNIVFSDNSASEGGGMRNEFHSNPILRNVVFRNNTAGRASGGMHNGTYSSPTLTNGLFEGNVGGLGPGGLGNFVSNAVLTNVTFKDNTATMFGGGVVNNSGIQTFTNVTFSGNSAEFGGGMWNSNTSPTLTNVTFKNNSASTTGGGIYSEDNTNMVVRNTILWGNTAPTGSQIHNDNSAATISDSVVQGGFAGGTNIITVDPLLGPLADNGGFTQTMALGAGSPAINAGTNTDCPETDQRGVSRSDGQCDIGAYEYRLDATFGDVPTSYWAWIYIEALYNAGVTSGCSISPKLYCPTTTVTRDQMAVFLLKAKYGSGHIPPAPTGVFQDVPTDYWAAPWIEELAAEGITSGCSVSPKLYCPTTTVTRDQMAVFLLKAKHGSGYTPPTPTGVFEDVITDYWAASWIERLAAEGITGGCSVTPKLYCPATPVSRDQMAIFLDKTFGIPLP